MVGVLRGEYPIAEILHQSELSLPISIGHTEKEIKNVCEIISTFESRRGDL